ncbi:amidohydrolase family protein, partial [Escherichia coli]
MPQYLIRQAKAVVGYEIPQDIRIHDGVIVAIAPTLDRESDDELIDASHCVVYPGFVNTHHHLAQSILKGVPAGLN